MRPQGHRRAVVAIAAGGALALSLPTYSIWPLGVVGCTLCMFALRSDRARERWVAAALIGAAWFGLGLVFVAQFSLLGFVAVVLAETAFLVAGALCAMSARASPVAFSSMVGLVEFSRARWPFGGLPLASIALGQVGGPFGPVARLAGPLGVEVVTALFGAGAAGLVLGLRSRAQSRSRVEVVGCDHSVAAGCWALAASITIAVAAVFAPSGGPVVATRRVGLVQGGGPRGTSQIEVPPIDAFYRTLVASRGLPVGLDLVIWPEDTVPLTRSGLSSSIGTAFAGAARTLRTTLAGGVTEPVGDRGFLNELVAVDARGAVVGRFEKVHAVPFGEYVPFRSFFSRFANLTAVPLDAVVGSGSGLLITRAAPLAVLLSYETFFTGRGRSGVGAGGELLVVATNTASYASPQVPSQELAASRLQAIAEGRELVQAATTGTTAVIEPDGAVVESIGLGRSGTLVPTVGLRDGLTVFDRFGEYPLLVAVGLICTAQLAVGCRRWWVQRRAEHGGSPTR